MSKMGARVARLFRDFNLENRVHREIGKAKPEVAPRHLTHIDSVQSTEGEYIGIFVIALKNLCKSGGSTL